MHTFKENGKYTEASKMPVSPKAEVSVTPADKYVFDYWTIDESQKDYSSEMGCFEVTEVQSGYNIL